MREALESVERISREHGGGQGATDAAPAAGGGGVELDIDSPAGDPVDPAQASAMGVQIEALAKEVESLQGQLRESEEKYKRALADQENFRKRTQKERLDIIRFGHEKFAGEVLQVLDNFQRALSHTQGLPQDPAVEQFVTGIRMTATLFEQAIEKYGIKPVSGIGAAFDPAIHQAMQQIERGDVPPGQVVDLYQKGYMIYERLLRPALVGVSRAPAAVPEPDAMPAGGASASGQVSPDSESGNGSGEAN